MSISIYFTWSKEQAEIHLNWFLSQLQQTDVSLWFSVYPESAGQSPNVSIWFVFGPFFCVWRVFWKGIRTCIEPKMNLWGALFHLNDVCLHICLCMEDLEYCSIIKSSLMHKCLCRFATCTHVCVNRCVWTGVCCLWQWAVLFDACVELDRHAWVAQTATWEHAGNTKDSVMLTLNQVSDTSII